MSDLPLTRHPSLPTDMIERFTAGVERDMQGGLRFRYVVEGPIDRIALPVRVASRQTDDLWHHTCFEAFMTAEDHPAYLECNFSPSTAWATYSFSRFRTGMTTIVPLAPPHITLKVEHDRLVLEARVHLGDFTARSLRIGLTTVIEDKAGKLSYWALRHPLAKPEFHHRGGFILRLAAPSVRI